jgi:predicted PurR-regulated permease PerM
MAEEITTAPGSAESAAPPEISDWRRLGQRMRSTKPVTVARYALVIGALAALVWLANTAWQSLLPFIVGGFIAYAVLPFVNRLDRIMPRWFASLVVVSSVFAFIVLFIATLMPLLVRQFMTLINSLPTVEQLESSADQINQSLSTLPEPLRVVLDRVLEDVGVSFRTEIDAFIGALPQAIVQATLSLLNTFSAVLGLLVLPAWLLTVLKDGRRAARKINTLVPPAVRLDFWSIVRIVDRSLRAFLQRQVTQAFLVGAGVTAVAWGLDRIGLVNAKYPLAVGLVAGTFELIPEVGPIIVYLWLAFSSLPFGPEVLLVNWGAFYLIRRFVGQFVEARVATHVKEPHRAVMALLAIMLSQVGFVYALLSVPIVVMSRDLFRYLYGRLSDPRQPAGLLPDDPRPIAPPEQQVLVKLRTPLVYRRAARKRRTVQPVTSQPTNQSEAS